MPVYEYKCTSCDFSFEKRQGFDAEPVCICPQCRNKATRIFQPAPIIFKGKGFYVTDYPSRSANTSQSKSEEVAETESKKETETKTESELTAASKPANE